MTIEKRTKRTSSLALGLVPALVLGLGMLGCSGSAGRPASSTGGQGGEETGGSTGSDTGGKSGSTGGSSGSTGGSSGSTGGSGGGGSTGGSGGADTGGSGGSTLADAAAPADSSPPSSDGGHKIDPKSPILACNGGYNLQGVTADDFCSFYEMYCMYDPTGMAKNPSGTALPPGTGSWFYKDRADCIMRYDMASTAAKGCRAGQLCKNKAGGCTHATGHFSNCP